MDDGAHRGAGCVERRLRRRLRSSPPRRSAARCSSALLMIETLLVVFLAPAFTAGAISLEREKQTLDLLATTPDLVARDRGRQAASALTFVFLLILSSIPLTAIVFVFGGVGPDDLLRGYLILFVTAFGLGAVGLFVSALVRRTQGATVVTFFLVLALTLGTGFVFSSGATWPTGGWPDRPGQRVGRRVAPAPAARAHCCGSTRSWPRPTSCVARRPGSGRTARSSASSPTGRRRGSVT